MRLGAVDPDTRREDKTSVSVALLLVPHGIMFAGIVGEDIATALDRLYCTPTSCTAWPQMLIGVAIATSPLLVHLWRRSAAIYLATFLLGLTGSLLIMFDFWLLPLTSCVAGLLVASVSIGISRLT